MGYFIIQLMLPAEEILVKAMKSSPYECLNGGFSAECTHLHSGRQQFWWHAGVWVLLGEVPHAHFVLPLTHI
jgi:hypothetical protein